MEGAYLIVNKNLIELAALAVVFAFRTGTHRRARSVVVRAGRVPSNREPSKGRQHDHHRLRRRRRAAGTF